MTVQGGFSGSDCPPLSKGGCVALLEDGSANEMAFEGEVIVDRGLCGGETLERFDVSEPLHGAFAPSQNLK